MNILLSAAGAIVQQQHCPRGFVQTGHFSQGHHVLHNKYKLDNGNSPILRLTSAWSLLCIFSF